MPSVTCPACSRRYAVEQQLPGKWVRCKCGIRFDSATEVPEEISPTNEVMSISDPVDPACKQFQEELDALHDGEGIVLDRPRERPGPVVINRSIAIAGRGVTIWALRGPVVTVAADKVKLRNLQIEHTGHDIDDASAEKCALLIKGKGVILDDVEVRGNVIGLPEEEGIWRYPHQLMLGPLAHGMEHVLRMRITVPVPCQLTSSISGLDLDPQSLLPGAHEVRIHIERMSQDTLISGSIVLKSAFLKRRMTVNAHIVAPCEGLPEPCREQNKIVWSPPDWQSVIEPRSIPTSPKIQPITPDHPPAVTSVSQMPTQDLAGPGPAAQPVYKLKRITTSPLGKLFSPPVTEQPVNEIAPNDIPIPPPSQLISPLFQDNQDSQQSSQPPSSTPASATPKVTVKPASSLFNSSAPAIAAASDGPDASSDEAVAHPIEGQGTDAQPSPPIARKRAGLKSLSSIFIKPPPPPDEPLPNV